MTAKIIGKKGQKLTIEITVDLEYSMLQAGRQSIATDAEERENLARHPTSCNSGTPVALINSLTERLGNALVRPASASTSHKSRYVKATSNGLTAIRNAILASLACS